VVLSQIFPSPSFCLSQIMWFIKLYMFIYPGFGFVIGFRFEDLVFSDVATCNLMEVYGNFRGITGSNHLDRWVGCEWKRQCRFRESVEQGSFR